MKSLLVTGATGLVGSNVCEIAARKGYRVRALVRSKADTESLVAAGAELAIGDVTDVASLDRAMKGVDYVIHGAAQIGGTWSKATPQDFEKVNQWGSINVLAAAERAGVKRTVSLLTAILFDKSETLTENSRLTPISDANSPYTRTKLAAFYEGMSRAARGQDITFVVPGGIYGPAPIFDRAIVPTSFNGTLLMALNGELKRYLGMPITWVYTLDVANISMLALEQGKSGVRYLAAGPSGNGISLPDFCNRALSLAGRKNRVETFDPSKPGAETDSEFGTMAKLLQTKYPEPQVDCTATTAALGYQPTSIEDGLKATLAWFKANGKL